MQNLTSIEEEGPDSWQCSHLPIFEERKSTAVELHSGILS